MLTLTDILHAPGAKACDIDNVAIPFTENIIPLFNYTFKNRLHRSFHERDYLWLSLENLNISREAGITKEEVYTMFKYAEKNGIIEHIMPKVYCISSLNTLAASEKLFFLTSRGNGFYEDPIGMTNRWQEHVKAKHKHFTPLEVLYNHNKEEALKKHNITMLFEDDPSYALRVLENDIPVVLFNYPYNILHSNDKNALPREIYEQKVETINKLNRYEGKLLFRANWHEVFLNLVYKK
jgi:uncharacterized HAD superfamily protein